MGSGQDRVGTSGVRELDNFGQEDGVSKETTPRMAGDPVFGRGEGTMVLAVSCCGQMEVKQSEVSLKQRTLRGTIDDAARSAIMGERVAKVWGG